MPGRYVALSGIIGVYLALATAYALATPAWNYPDEPAHFNYVAHVVETGTLPVLVPGDHDAARHQILIVNRFPEGESVDFLRYENWQPPLYYLVGAVIMRIIGDVDPLRQLYTLRAYNIALGALTLVTSYLLARAVFDRFHAAGCQVAAVPPAWLALFVPAGIVGIPMFTALSSGVNNDNLGTFLGTMLTLAAIRTIDIERAAASRNAASSGVLLGLGVLTKLTLVFFVPVLILAQYTRSIRFGERPRQFGERIVAMLAVMLLILAPWLVRQGLAYGWDDLFAKQRHDLVLAHPPLPPLTYTYLAETATLGFRSFWLFFEWSRWPVIDHAPYVFWWALVQTAGVGVMAYTAAHASRISRWLRESPGRELLILGTTFAGAIAVLLYWNLTSDRQPQGRFLFGSLGSIATLLILGWAVLLPERIRLVGLATLCAALLSINVWALSALLI